MKRVLCVLLLLAMAVPVLLIPSMAAEDYVLYPCTLPVVLDDLDLSPETSGEYFGWFSGEFIITDGNYLLRLVSSDGNSFVSAEPFSICWEASDIDGVDRSFKVYADFDLSFSDGSYYSAVRCYVRGIESSGISFCTVGPDVPADSEIRTLWRSTNISLFTLTLSAVSPVPALIKVITSDSLYGVFNEIVSLLPVVLVVLVGYIAVRKGFAWIQGFLHEV